MSATDPVQSGQGLKLDSALTENNNAGSLRKQNKGWLHSRPSAATQQPSLASTGLSLDKDMWFDQLVSFTWHQNILQSL